MCRSSSRHSRPRLCRNRHSHRADPSQNRRAPHHCRRRCHCNRACHRNRCPCPPSHIHTYLERSCSDHSGNRPRPPLHIRRAECKMSSSCWDHPHRLHRSPHTRSAPSAAYHPKDIRPCCWTHSRQAGCKPRSSKPGHRIRRHPRLRTTSSRRYKTHHPTSPRHHSYMQTHPYTPRKRRFRCPRWHCCRSCSPHCPCTRNQC